MGTGKEIFSSQIRRFKMATRRSRRSRGDNYEDETNLPDNNIIDTKRGEDIDLSLREKTLPCHKQLQALISNQNRPTCVTFGQS